MKRQLPLLLIFIVLIICNSCEDVFQYSPNEVRPHEKDINKKNIDRINSGGDTLKFIVISDIHHAYEELRDFVDTINKEEGIRFVLVAGDLTNFGLQFEFEEVHNDLSRLYAPYISGIGNHDLLANGQEVFEQMYGPLDFTFKVGGNKFVFINTCSREYNFEAAVPDLDYLKKELSDTNSYSNAIVVGHVPPYDSDFNPANEKDFNDILETGKVRAAIYGHQHSYHLSDYYENGIPCLLSDDLKDRSYVLVKVTGSSIVFEQKTF